MENSIGPKRVNGILASQCDHMHSHIFNVHAQLCDGAETLDVWFEPSSTFILTFLKTHLRQHMRILHRLHMGLIAKKPVLGGLRTTKAQTSLRICAV